MIKLSNIYTEKGLAVIASLIPVDYKGTVKFASAFHGAKVSVVLHEGSIDGYKLVDLMSSVSDIKCIDSHVICDLEVARQLHGDIYLHGDSCNDAKFDFYMSEIDSYDLMYVQRWYEENIIEWCGEFYRVIDILETVSDGEYSTSREYALANVRNYVWSGGSAL